MGCPGPGDSWGDLAILPASKEAESPSRITIYQIISPLTTPTTTNTPNTPNRIRLLGLLALKISVMYLVVMKYECFNILVRGCSGLCHATFGTTQLINRQAKMMRVQAIKLYYLFLMPPLTLLLRILPVVNLETPPLGSNVVKL